MVTFGQILDSIWFRMDKAHNSHSTTHDVERFYAVDEYREGHLDHCAGIFNNHNFSR